MQDWLQRLIEVKPRFSANRRRSATTALKRRLRYWHDVLTDAHHVDDGTRAPTRLNT
jgi:sRNA-binding protein